jgi:hypothetical protein
MESIEGLQTVLPFLANGVAQVAYVVEDVEATAMAYHRQFGIGPWHFYTYGKPLLSCMKRYGEPTEYRMRVGLSYFGSMRIELIQHLEGDTVYADFIKKHGTGIQHLVFWLRTCRTLWIKPGLPESLSRWKAGGMVPTVMGILPTWRRKICSVPR